MADPIRRRHRDRDLDLAFRRELLLEMAEAEALARDALRRLFTEYYLACTARGGFWEFVRASGWDPYLVAQVRDGLELIGMPEQLRRFERGAAAVKRLGPGGLRRLLDEGAPPQSDTMDP